MPKSLNNLIDEANRGTGEPLIFSDALLDLLKRVTHTCLATDTITWPNNVASADPTAVAAHPISYFRLDDAGKQQFCVRFSSGAIQVLATEP